MLNQVAYKNIRYADYKITKIFGLCQSKEESFATPRMDFWYFRIFLTLNSNDILDEKIYYREAI